MSSAPNYTPSNSFADDETNQASGRSTVRTGELDAQFADISTSINDLNSNLQKIQRDDDKLRDFVVEPYATSVSFRAMLVAAGKNIRGEWAAFVNYAVGDLVQRNAVAYLCQTSHNSGPAFNLGFWIAISGDGQAQAWAEVAQAAELSTVASAAQASISAGNAISAAAGASFSALGAQASALAAQNSADSIAALSPVNLGVYMLDFLGAASANAARGFLGVSPSTDVALKVDLASTGDAAKGDAMVGVKRSPVASVTSTLHNWIDGTVIIAAEVGIAPANSSASNTALLNALIAASPGRKIYFPGYAGTYQFGDINLTTGTHHWFGDGVEGTKFRYTGTGTFLNAEKAADAFLPRSPIYLDGIQFDGVTKGTKVGLSIKNRHDYVVRNCDFRNFSTLIKLEMAYIGLFDNVNGTACDTGWDIVGDINRVLFQSCGVTDFATYGVRIRPGTFGCIALAFDNCDLEFAGGVCIRLETDDHVTFRDCYLGDGCTGNVFEITTGQAVMDGGLVLFGQNAAFSNRLVEFVGANPTTDERSLDITGAKISGGSFAGIDGEKMVKGTGKLYVGDSGLATKPTWGGGAKILTGDPLGKRPGLNALQSPYGRTFTGAKTGTATFTLVPNLANGGGLLTCTAAGGVGDTVFAWANLLAGKLQTFGALGAVIVYRSNGAWGAQLANGPGGTFNQAPTVSMGSTVLGNTAGAIASMVVQGQHPLGAAYQVIEIFRANCTVGDYIEILEVYLFDERQYGNPGTLYAGKNLFKPI